MLDFTEAGQPSIQVEPDPQELPGAQLASGPWSLAASDASGGLDPSDDASERFRSVPASAIGWQWAFIALVPGPVFGVLALRGLRVADAGTPKGVPYVRRAPL